MVTASDPEGGHVGVTANSFNSVSLDPPLVLWSLARSARSFDAFMAAEWFAINVLNADQEELSRHFALRQPDKFAGLDFEEGPHGLALLTGSVATFICRRHATHDGGDHVILIGAVEQFEYHDDREPLVFCRGDYSGFDENPGV